MSGWHITVEDFRRVIVAAAGMFGDKVPAPRDLMRLVRASGDEPGSGPQDLPPPLADMHQYALRLRAALVEAHGQDYLDDLLERIRK